MSGTKTQPLNKLLFIPFTIWLVSLAVFFSLLLLGEKVSYLSLSFIAHLIWSSLALGVSAFVTLWLVGLLQLFKPDLRKSAILYIVGSLMVCSVILITLAILSRADIGQPYQLVRLSNTREQQSFAPGIAFSEAVLSAPSASPKPTPLATSRPKPTPVPQDPYALDPDLKDAAWGQAVEVAPHTYRMKVSEDEAMSTVEELYQALNVYRSTKGKGSLRWDEGLTDFAEERIVEIPSETEAHAGFKKRLEGPEYFEKYHFSSYGENASQGYKMTGTHLIEWLYAADAGHDSNQLGEWSHVGIAVANQDTVLIFGLKY